jgi:uncharacterized protein YndB with AHSA1/START domain
MPPIVSSIDIARPPGEVFAYATDPSRFPEWQRDVVRVRIEGAMTQEITQCRAPSSWAARGVDGPIRPNATVTIEPLDGGARSRVTFALDFEGHGIGRPLLPAVRRQTQKAAPVSYRNLKERLERGA